MLLSLLAGCQLTPDKPIAQEQSVNPPRPVTQFDAPSSLAGWHYEGYIDKGDTLRLMRFSSLADKPQVMNVSIYPLPFGWQSLRAKEQLARHYGMLSQQLIERAQHDYRAQKVVSSGMQFRQPTAKQLWLESRFTSTLPDASQQVTLIALTQVAGNFIRLSLTCQPQKSAHLEQALRQAGQGLTAYWLQTMHLNG